MPRVLVVDDETEVVDFICNFLKRFKISTEKSNDGKETLETFERVRPDWVLLDIKMPDMDGFEVLKKLKEKDPQVKVMMITGSEDKDSQGKAKQLGAADYIIKPLDLEELHSKIHAHILKK